MKWSELIVKAGLVPAWSGGADPDIRGIEEDSRQVGEGSCFVAVKGTHADGHDYIDAAIQRGASAIVCERLVEMPASVAVLQLPRARGAAGRLAAVLHGLDETQRQGQLKVIGITGTNGKSTFCYLMQAILRQAQRPTALLGTIQYDLLSRVVEASHTTPPSSELMRYLAEAVHAGATHAVMEVSSHALDQGRTDGIQFAVGVFSNLTGDHLDYHGDTQNYLRAKKRLFDGLADDAMAVINAEASVAREIVGNCRAGVLWYAVDDGHCDLSAYCRHEKTWGVLTASVREMTARGTNFDLVLQKRDASGSFSRCGAVTVQSALVGRHNVQNCLAAAGVAIALNVPMDVIAQGLESMKLVPGRLQRVDAGDEGSASDPGFSVLVDYAHTDDALKNVLTAVKPLVSAGGKLIVLFGCGGDRDRTKRPRMAQVTAQYANRIILTSDNPRTEDPDAIIREVLTGFTEADLPRVRVQPDRRAAIAEAIGLAQPGDIVLLAGKGHETYQEIGRQRFPFDDVRIAAELLAGR